MTDWRTDRVRAVPEGRTSTVLAELDVLRRGTSA